MTAALAPPIVDDATRRQLLTALVAHLVELGVTPIATATGNFGGSPWPPELAADLADVQPLDFGDGINLETLAALRPDPAGVEVIDQNAPNLEQIAALRPDLILTRGSNIERLRDELADAILLVVNTDDERAQLESQQLWQRLPAVQAGRVVELDYSKLVALRAGPLRVPLAIDNVVPKLLAAFAC